MSIYKHATGEAQPLAKAKDKVQPNKLGLSKPRVRYGSISLRPLEELTDKQRRCLSGD